MVKIRYLGVSAFEITTEGGTNLLIDPYISESCWCPIRVEDLKEVDFVLVSHGSSDHLGDALEIVEKTGALLVCGSDVAELARKRGLPETNIIETYPYGAQREFNDVKVKAVEARHVHRIRRTEKDDRFVLGVPMGFVISDANGVTVYHSGDTCIFGDMKLIGELYRPNIMMIEVGALPGFIPVSSPFELALTVRWIRPDVVIPMHDPKGSATKLFLDYVKVGAPHSRVVVMKPGGILRFQPFQVEDLTSTEGV